MTRRAVPALLGILIALSLSAQSLPAPPIPIPTAIRGTLSADGGSASIRIVVANRASRASFAATVEVYLSADGLVDDGDRLLDSRPLGSLLPHAERELAMTARFPEVPPGRYYLIARSRPSESDAAPAARHDLWGAPMLIGPDLLVAELKATAERDGGLLVVATVTNAGTRATPASHVALVLLDDARAGASVPVMRLDLQALEPGRSATATGTASLPDAPPGRYAVVAEVDPDRRIAEADEGNNAARGDGEYGLGPDLLVAAISAMLDGEVLALADTVLNRGTGAAAACGISFFLSRNGVLDADDTPLGYRVVAALAPGARAQGTTHLSVPPRTATGRYYVLAKVDSSGAVAESDERNNVAIAPEPLDIRRP